MKKTLNLLMLIWVATLSSCNADEPRIISAIEDYNREFIKQFGVPAAGHDFSMATTAGLKVTSANGDHITVTAEIDGTEYLFADCHVPAGTTSIPVTIPREVSQLKLASSRGERTVAVNALVNLDEIKSETMRLEAPHTAEGNPYMVFFVDDFMKGFFEKDKSNIKYYPNNIQHYCNRANKGYIFPLYFRTDKDGYVDYDILFTTSYPNGSEAISTDIVFDDNDDETNLLSSIKWTYAPLDLDNYIYKEPYDKILNYYTGSQLWYTGEAYPMNWGKMLLSRGIRVEDYYDREGNIKWYLEMKYGFKDSDNYSISSENPYRNIQFWNGNYFDIPLKSIMSAHHSAFEFNGTKKIYIYDESIEDCKISGKFIELNVKNAYIIGFNTAPTSPAFNFERDYSDAIFLWVPLESYSGSTISTGSNYCWTIAAEDLGATDDWDFNDAVFTFTDQIKDLNSENIYWHGGNTKVWGPRDAEPVRVITVTPKAAGGTMPIYITYTGKVGKVPQIPDGSKETADIMYSEANQAIKDYMKDLEYSEGTHIVGKELHAWLGAESYKTMVNTGENDQNLKPQEVSFVIPVGSQLGVGYDAANGTFDIGNDMASVANKSLCGFAVLVDRDNALNIDAMNDIEQGMHRAENLTLGNGTYVIGRPDATGGEIAPQMLLIKYYWNWPRERVKISDAYPDFSSWLADPASTSKWTNNYVKEKVTR